MKIATTNGMARRINICYMTQAELTIQNAIWEIEKLGADVRLTNAQRLLGEAKDLVSEYVDEIIVDKEK